ncbi:hypothetical protein BDB01DRAFT_786602 [Pilobolus umbonatus]|nr:hypothetical protein BDB01DRAFT_786602 [Pilobolus umbonatus]
MNRDKLLLVFIHGFRGSDLSFKDYPNRLQAILNETVNADVICTIYPSYKTAGDLRVAVEDFTSWLYNEVSKQRQELKRLYSNGNLMVVLLGHSMGGIVAAETILRFNKQAEHDPLLGAAIVGLIAYDTPFYSINESFVAKRAVSEYGKVNKEIKEMNQYWSMATSTLNSRSIQSGSSSSRTVTTTSKTTSGSSNGKKWGLLAGVLGVAAVGAVAYLARDKITSTLNDVYDELTFVKDLTDMHGCEERVDKLIQIPDIVFKCFYVQIDDPDNENDHRTFIRLPPEEVEHLFVPVLSNADNEIKAHTAMFDPSKSDQYYQMGSDTISLIHSMVVRYQLKHPHPD